MEPHALLGRCLVNTERGGSQSKEVQDFPTCPAPEQRGVSGVGAAWGLTSTVCRGAAGAAESAAPTVQAGGTVCFPDAGRGWESRKQPFLPDTAALHTGKPPECSQPEISAGGGRGLSGGPCPRLGRSSLSCPGLPGAPLAGSGEGGRLLGKKRRDPPGQGTAPVLVSPLSRGPGEGPTEGLGGSPPPSRGLRALICASRGALPPCRGWCPAQGPGSPSKAAPHGRAPWGAVAADTQSPEGRPVVTGAWVVPGGPGLLSGAPHRAAPLWTGPEQARLITSRPREVVWASAGLWKVHLGPSPDHGLGGRVLCLSPPRAEECLQGPADGRAWVLHGRAWEMPRGDP